MVELGVARAEHAVGDLELARQQADLAVVAHVAADVGVALEMAVVADLDDRLVDRDDARRLGVQQHMRARVLHLERAGGAARAELARQVLGAEVDGGQARMRATERRRVGHAGDRLQPADDEARRRARRIAVEPAHPVQRREELVDALELGDDDAVDIGGERGREVVEVVVGLGLVDAHGQHAAERLPAQRGDERTDPGARVGLVRRGRAVLEVDHVAVGREARELADQVGAIGRCEEEAADDEHGGS